MAAVGTRMGTVPLGTTAATSVRIATATDVPMRVVVRNLGGAVRALLGDSPMDAVAPGEVYTLLTTAPETFLLAPHQELYATAAAAGVFLSYMTTPLDARWKTDSAHGLGHSRMRTVLFPGLTGKLNPQPQRLAQASERPLRLMVRNTSASNLLIAVDPGDLIVQAGVLFVGSSYTVLPASADVVLLMPGQVLYGITPAGAATAICLEENEGLLLTDNILLL